MSSAIEQQALDHWLTYKKEFDTDGSLRDIFIAPTNIHDWHLLASLLSASTYKLEFKGKWPGPGFPAGLDSLFYASDDQETAVLAIDLSGVCLHCHFFSQAAIEFDLVPAEVAVPSQLAAIFNFLQLISEALGKAVVLAPENQWACPIFSYSPGNDLVEYIQFYNLD